MHLPLTWYTSSPQTLTTHKNHPYQANLIRLTYVTLGKANLVLSLIYKKIKSFTLDSRSYLNPDITLRQKPFTNPYNF